MSRNLSQPCAGKWAPRGEVRAGVAVELSEQGRKPARGAWTTPDAGACNVREAPETFLARQQAKRAANRAAGSRDGTSGTPLGQQVQRWPTPDASAHNQPHRGAGAQGGPTLSDAARGDGAEGRVGREARPSLNPAWVCSLMGFPEGWV